MYRLENWCFMVSMGPGYLGDTWCLTGEVYDHPYFSDGAIIHISTPKEIISDEPLQIRTVHGTEYELGSCLNSLETSLQELKEVITRGSYQTL